MLNRRVPNIGQRRHRRRSIGSVLVLVLAGGLGAQACSTDPSFAVGDCVRIETRFIDSNLDKVDCDGAVGTFNFEERVYRVNQVIDGTGGGCPRLQGFFPVEFVHEPDDVTYCLVQES